ncbi:sensor histidine kinase [Sediminibacterium goheungense]|uniref:Signal transduction histidine kinase n=1 Tax=Sediminibacterium goheungense TaxID=1086393 RepID=A0A4V6PSI9_9BACT|nr:HAMP domain-containing sensor histidine kinase [Sediminibacterium goheungense]TDO27028.1 signal transduction histidine kinase [Sediminibacterium goheungense]
MFSEKITFTILLILLGMAIALIIYLFFHFRTKIRKLTCEIDEKNAILSHYQLKLESVEIDLKNNITFRERAISIVVHDLRSPLSFLHKTLVHLNQSSDAITPKMLKRLTDEMSFSSYQIVGFVNDLLEWLKNNNKGFIESSSIGQLHEFIRSKCAIYIDMAQKKGLEMKIDLKPDYYIRTDFNLLQIILRNLLDNAIKNTDTGSISITGYPKDGKNYIIITDTGNGMSKDKATELEFGVITKKTNESTQIGFRIVHDLATLLKGKIRIITEPNRGSSITLELPNHGTPPIGKSVASAQ